MIYLFFIWVGRYNNGYVGERLGYVGLIRREDVGLPAVSLHLNYVGTMPTTKSETIFIWIRVISINAVAYRQHSISNPLSIIPSGMFSTISTNAPNI